MGNHLSWSLYAGPLLAGLGRFAALFRRPLRPIDDAFQAVPEVNLVGREGYEIRFRSHRPSRKYERYAFQAFRQGRAVGALDADHIDAGNRLYIANVHVVEAHGNRGVGTALLLCAAKITHCRVLTTSSRTRQGVRFFRKNRAVLARHGVEMSDAPL